MTMNFIVIVQKYVRHTEETAYKKSGPVWNKTTFLPLCHLVTSIFYTRICNSFA